MLVLLLSLVASPVATAQTGEWRAYGADTAGTRYSSLDQITADNAGVGSTLVVLNARTGARYPDFGVDGEVDLTQGYDTRTVTQFAWRSAPLVVNDIVIVGSAVTDFINETMPARKEMPPGDVRGFDVRTGEQLWIFHTVPQEGEAGNETWLTGPDEDRASWEYTGNTNVGGADWSGAAVDPQTGTLYVPTVRTPAVVGLARSEHPRSNVDFVMQALDIAEGPQGLPLLKPPYGSLVAIDLHAGEIRWRVPNGDGLRDHPAIRHLNLPPLGLAGRVSPLVTGTAVFLGEGVDRGMVFTPEGRRQAAPGVRQAHRRGGGRDRAAWQDQRGADYAHG